MKLSEVDIKRIYRWGKWLSLPGLEDDFAQEAALKALLTPEKYRKGLKIIIRNHLIGKLRYELRRQRDLVPLQCAEIPQMDIYLWVAKIGDGRMQTIIRGLIERREISSADMRYFYRNRKRLPKI